MKVKNTVPGRIACCLALLLGVGSQAAAQQPLKTMPGTSPRSETTVTHQATETARRVEATRDVLGAVPRLRSALGLTRERAAFSTETRLPLVRFGKGHLEVACVQQRVHYAALQELKFRRDIQSQAEPFLPRGYTSYGLRLSFNFGRVAPAARPTILALVGKGL